MGLTPQDIGQALQLSTGMLEFEAGRDPTSIANRYKEALITQMDLAAERPFVIPGTDIKLSSAEARQWYTATTKDDRTAAIKNYEYYVKQQQDANEHPLPFETWDREERTGKQKDYERALDEGWLPEGGSKPTFHKWNLEMTKAGALTITDIRKRKEVGEEVKGEAYFSSPKFMQDIAKGIDEGMGWLSDDPELEKRAIQASRMDSALKVSPYVKSSNWVEARKGWEVEFESGKKIFIGAP